MPKTVEECWSLVRWANDLKEAMPTSSSIHTHVSYRDGPYNVPSLAVSGAWQGIIESREPTESTVRSLDQERGASLMAARSDSSGSGFDPALLQGRAEPGPIADDSQGLRCAEWNVAKLVLLPKKKISRCAKTQSGTFARPR